MCQEDIKNVLICEPNKWFTSREIFENVKSNISINSVGTNLRRLAKWNEIVVKKLNSRLYLYKLA